MLERVLGIILPVFSIIALGWWYGRRTKPDMGWVNRISMNVLAPALIFSALASKEFDVYENGRLILGSIGIVLGSGLLAWPVARWLKADFRTFVPPMMFNNCGNMGLPLAALAFGPPGFSAMVAVFTISNLLHFTVGAWMIDHHARFGRLLRNPMVWSTIVGFAFALTHPPLPEWAASTFKIVGDALIPMMLLSLGVRLMDVRWSDWRIGVVGGLVCPLTGIGMAALLSPVSRARRCAAGSPHPVRLPAACRAQLHGRGAVPAGAREGRLDRADRQHDLDRVRAARARAGAQVSVCDEDRAMNLHRLLLARAAAGHPLRVGLIGAGKFGAMYLAQAKHTAGIHIVGIADLAPDRARAALARTGWAPQRFAARSFAEAGKIQCHSRHRRCASRSSRRRRSRSSSTRPAIRRRGFATRWRRSRTASTW